MIALVNVNLQTSGAVTTAPYTLTQQSLAYGSIYSQ